MGGRAYGLSMDRDQVSELEGQTSIDELIDVPFGATFVQMVLPIYIQECSGSFRRLS